MLCCTLSVCSDPCCGGCCIVIVQKCFLLFVRLQVYVQNQEYIVVMKSL